MIAVIITLRKCNKNLLKSVGSVLIAQVGGKTPCTSNSYSLTRLYTCLSTRQLLFLHSEQYICRSDNVQFGFHNIFPKLATNITWAPLTGTRGGQSTLFKLPFPFYLTVTLFYGRIVKLNRSLHPVAFTDPSAYAIAYRPTLSIPVLLTSLCSLDHVICIIHCLLPSVHSRLLQFSAYTGT
jgi:hypothetical protein